MRSDTPSNKPSNKLTLIDRNGNEISGVAVDDVAIEYSASASSEKDSDAARGKSDAARSKNGQLIVFIAVSIACATAAIAAGSYAAWLSRHKAAEDALTNVHDLLASCRDRMLQLEHSLNSLPG